ncbi:MAG: vWA domain-containing protein [Desulfomonilaceae bacterium]
MVSYSSEENHLTSLTPPVQERACSDEAMFLCPDWRMARKRPEIESVVAAFRRIVLPRLTTRPGFFTGNAWLRTRSRKVQFNYGQSSSAVLDLDATIERISPNLCFRGLNENRGWINKEDIIVKYRPEPASKLLVMLDTSLSMNGPYRTSAALIGSILAKHSPSGGLALLVFDSEPKLLIHFGERLKPIEAAYRVLMSPFGGVTNIGAALRYGLTVIGRSNHMSTQAILITDGERTAGIDPRGPAKRFKKLHVTLVGKRNVGIGKEIAHLGKGAFRQVDSLASVPEILFWLMRRLYRD